MSSCFFYADINNYSFTNLIKVMKLYYNNKTPAL